MYFKRIGLALTIFLNVLTGGYSNQTFSARNWDRKKKGQLNIAFFIDFLFIILSVPASLIVSIVRIEKVKLDWTGHCMQAWVHWKIMKNALGEIYDGDILIIDKVKELDEYYKL